MICLGAAVVSKIVSARARLDRLVDGGVSAHMTELRIGQLVNWVNLVILIPYARTAPRIILISARN